MRATRLVRRACFAGALVLAVTALVGPSLAPAQAQVDDPEAGRPTAFVADSEAFATQVLVNTVPPQFFAEILNARSPYTTGHFETGSTSNAKASLLNPGLAVTGLATLCQAGLPCDQVPNFPPPYPLMADASYPIATDATAQANFGDIAMGPLVTTGGDARAHAGRDKVTADATAAGNRLGTSAAPLVRVGSSTASTSLEFSGDGSLVATAIAAVHDVNVLGLLHIDAVEARSTSTANADGTKANDVHLDVSGATLAGIPVTIGESGLAIGGPPQGGDILSQLGKAVSPLLGAFRGSIRTLGTSDVKDEGGATGSVAGIAIDVFPNLDATAGVSPTITVLLGAAGSHAYAFDAPPFAPSAKATPAPSGTTGGSSSSAGTPGSPGTPGAAGAALPATTKAVPDGSTFDELVRTLLAGAAADRLKFFYLAWTLSMVGLALGSRLRPARLNGGVHGGTT